MLTGYPTVEIIEEGMREGMQIESASIPVETKVDLLDRLSTTGLKTIVVGSFVSPRWVPQMRNIEDLLARFEPNPDVRYTAVALNQKGLDRMRGHMPPLEPPAGPPRTLVHLCDVFVRRNTNRSQAQEIEGWPAFVEGARDRGAKDAGIGINAAWGSNWVGPFDLHYRMEMLQQQYSLWSNARIAVTKAWLGDPMAWNTPTAVAGQIRKIKEVWPSITTFHLHLHNARGSALVSAYAALEELSSSDKLILDTSIGGMGGCPYGGHGRMTRMIPTEDLVDLLEEVGISTGIDLDALIETANFAETVVGHELWGHVSKAGPRPRGDRLYPMDMPLIETKEQAQHFRLGPDVYEGSLRPWKEPIQSPMRTSLSLKDQA